MFAFLLTCVLVASLVCRLGCAHWYVVFLFACFRFTLAGCLVTVSLFVVRLWYFIWLFLVCGFALVCVVSLSCLDFGWSDWFTLMGVLIVILHCYVLLLFWGVVFGVCV